MTQIGQYILNWVQKDAIMIIVAILALAACIYTLNNVGDAQDKCNAYWFKQLEQMDCDCHPTSSYRWASPTLNHTTFIPYNANQSDD